MTACCKACGRLSQRVDSCEHCGTQGLLRHDELIELSIAHVDCDAFFAAIEKRDAPELADKPVIIGGGRRGVVATACYVARLYGVRSAMPMFKALKACPDAVVIKANFDKYSEASKQIRNMMEALTPLVQPVSIDEAYLDLTGTERVHDAAPIEMLVRLQKDIARRVGITVSVGLSHNKFLAKTASELEKPNGFSVIGRAETVDFLADKPIDFIHGVGPALAKQVNGKGFSRLGDLQDAELKLLIGFFGETGLWLKQRASGEDHRKVVTEGERKSVSSETTFDTDQSRFDVLEDQLWKTCERTSRRAKKAGVQGAVITLKLKTADFKSRTRRTSLTIPTQLAQTLFRTALPLLQKECDGTKFRLIGVGISDLEPARGDVADLIDESAAKRAAAERAADVARQKFGDNSIMTGRGARLLAGRKDGPK